MEEREGSTEASRLALASLRSAETALRADIEFKRRDIEWRQEKDYATAAVRGELDRLTTALQENLSEQRQLLSETPQAGQEKSVVHESAYAFVARMTGTSEGTAEFIMSTLCAVFINLISPLAVSASSSLKQSKRRKE